MQDLSFVFIETGGDKAPDLREDHRRGQQDAGDQGELQIKKNPSWYEVKISEVPSGRTSVNGLKNQVPIGRMTV